VHCAALRALEGELHAATVAAHAGAHLHQCGRRLQELLALHTALRAQAPPWWTQLLGAGGGCSERAGVDAHVLGHARAALAGLRRRQWQRAWGLVSLLSDWRIFGCAVGSR
jgi:hypothetical protein